MKWQKINLKRGITDSMKAWEWRHMVEEGKVDAARSNGTIVMVDQSGAPVAIAGQFDDLCGEGVTVSRPGQQPGFAVVDSLRNAINVC